MSISVPDARPRLMMPATGATVLSADRFRDTAAGEESRNGKAQKSVDSSDVSASWEKANRKHQRRRCLGNNPCFGHSGTGARPGLA